MRLAIFGASRRIPSFVAVFMGLVALCSSVLASDLPANHEFCWRDSAVRGVGTVPGCPPGMEQVGGLCYKPCPPGLVRAGDGNLDSCVTPACPSGWKDQGLFCAADRATYGRGLGKLKHLCENEHGVGRCEPEASLWYKKCDPGYTAAGSNICRLNVNCESLGMKSQGVAVFGSCAKVLVPGSGIKPLSTCPDGKVNQAGLCYSQCPGNYSQGVGPVCWSGAPNGWQVCGMGAAKDKDTCASVTTDQVTTVVQFAAFIATAGAGGAVNQGVNTAQKAATPSNFQKLQQLLKVAKDAIEAGQKTNESVAALTQLAQYISTDASKMTEEDIVRASADLVALFDPSGASAIVGAYTYPKCSKYFVPGASLKLVTERGPNGVNFTSKLPANGIVGGQFGQAPVGICRYNQTPGNFLGGKCIVQLNGQSQTIDTPNAYELLVAYGKSSAKWAPKSDIANMTRNSVDFWLKEGFPVVPCRTKVPADGPRGMAGNTLVGSYWIGRDNVCRTAWFSNTVFNTTDFEVLYKVAN